MLFINKLTKPGDIKKIVLRQAEVVVTTIDKQTIVYRRIDDNTSKT